MGHILLVIPSKRDPVWFTLHTVLTLAVQANDCVGVGASHNGMDSNDFNMKSNFVNGSLYLKDGHDTDCQKVRDFNVRYLGYYISAAVA
jgi:hypothetical protein